MNNTAILEAEREQLVAAAYQVSDLTEAGEIDLDAAIEELRPIRLRVYWIDCQMRNEDGVDDRSNGLRGVINEKL